MFEFELLLQKLFLKWPTEGQAIGVAIAIGNAPIAVVAANTLVVVAAATASQSDRNNVLRVIEF